MARDMEDRIRRSLQARSGDVQPNPATWETVQTRIRRRTWARWSVAGATAAAALLLAVLVLPGLLTQTRIDLGPADPLPDLTSGLVTTDGQTIAVRDAGGEVLAEFDPPTEADDPLPITRVAVRPGSSGDELTVAYTRADQDCERVETGWVTAAGDVTGGALGGGQGFCITDPVWSPEGDLLAWVEEDPDGGFSLAVHIWRSEAPAGDGAAGTRLTLETPVGLEALRATGWHTGTGDQPPSITFAGRRDGVVESYTLDVNPFDGALTGGALTGGGDAVVQPPAESQRSRLEADAGPAGPVAGAWDYELAVSPEGVVTLARDPIELALAPEVLVPGDLDSGAAWLAAGGDLVAFGAGANAWALPWQGDGWGDLVELTGVVHASVLSPQVEQPGPEDPEPGVDAELTLVATSGANLDVRLRGPERVTIDLVPDIDAEILDFAVHPDSTPEDLTVVWRQGRGCDASLHWAHYDGADTTTGDVPATCPGRPAFAPDGTHLAWVSQPDAGAEPGTGGFGLEALAWTDDGPADGGPVGFGFEAPMEAAFSFDLADWVWTQGTGTATAGTLHLVGYDTHGTPSAHTLPIERQGDGALALPAGATAQEQPAAIVQVDETGGPAYALESVPGGDPNTLRVVREVGGETDELPLPDGLLTVYGGAAETDNVWMTARGHDVLLGDGNGAAWHLPWTDDGWGELTELAGEVRYAVPLASAVPDEPRPEAEPPQDPAPEEPAPQDDVTDDEQLEGERPPADAAGDVPEPLDVIEHGGQYWAVLWVGEHADPELDRVREAIDRRWGPAWSDGEIGCDRGAAEALGVAPDARSVAVYFDAEEDARRFAEQAELPSKPAGYAEVTIFCLD